MTAAEKAIANVAAVIDGWPGNARSDVAALLEISRIIGAYGMERIGEFPPCPPRTDGAKPHCPDCSGIVGETGIV